MMKKIICMCIILSLVMTGCGKNSNNNSEKNITEDDKYGGIYFIPLGNEPSSLDPAFIMDGYQSSVATNIFVGLVKFNGKMEIKPALAESWQTSDDRKTWTFHLNKNAVFHNGAKVTSADVVYSLTRVLDPEVNSPRKNLFIPIEGAPEFVSGKAELVKGLQVVDEETVRIVLREPLAPFLSILAMNNAAIIPAGTGEDPSFGTKPIGAGPFMFKEWKPGEKIVLVRNEKYFDKKAYLEEIDFKIITNYEKLKAEFENGSLDEATLGFSKEEESRLHESSGIEFLTSPVWGVDYIGLNNKIKPLDNVLVRQALNYAIDWNSFLDEGTIRANGILPPGMPGYSKDIKGYEYDPQKAADLLEQAGYPGGLPMELDLWVNSDDGARAIGEFVQQQLAEIGVRVRLGQMDWNDLTESADRGKLMMFQIGWVADYPDPDTFFYPLFYSGNAGHNGNSSFYKNAEVDSLLVKAREMAAGDDHLAVYKQIEQKIVSDAPWIFMYHYTTTVAAQPWVRGRTVTGMGETALPLTDVWIMEME